MVFNISSRDKRKLFKSIHGKEKREMAIEIVSTFINSNQYTRDINENTKNLIKAAEYIMDRQATGKNSLKNLQISYNYVMTLISNDYKDYMNFTKIFNKKILESDGVLTLGEYIIKTDSNTTLFSNNPFDLFWIYENNNLYLVLPKRHTIDNDLGVIIEQNIYKDKSVKIPLIKSQYKNTPTLNGKDWVKHYILNNEVGYLYFIKGSIKNITFYKVGITKTTDRFKYKNIKILEKNFIKMDMLSAAIIEQYIHIMNCERRLFINDVDSTFEGKNECYHINLYNKYVDLSVEECLETVCNNKGYDKDTLLYVINNQKIKGE